MTKRTSKPRSSSLSSVPGSPEHERERERERGGEESEVVGKKEEEMMGIELISSILLLSHTSLSRRGRGTGPCFLTVEGLVLRPFEVLPRPQSLQLLQRRLLGILRLCGRVVPARDAHARLLICQDLLGGCVCDVGGGGVGRYVRGERVECGRVLRGRMTG